MVSRFGTTDFLLEVGNGNVPGHSLVHKFGRNDAVPNGSFAFVNTLGFTGWPLSAATTVRVKAGNAADDIAGAGARKVKINGIDDSYDEVTAEVDTAGGSASAVTSTSFIRVHRAWVSEQGTYGAANTAAVIVENSAGTTDLLEIAATMGQSEFAGWTVPRNKTAYLMSVTVHTQATKPADVALFMRESMDVTAAPLMQARRLKAYFAGIDGQFSFVPRSPISAPAKTDVWFEAQGAGAGGTASVDFELLVVDD